MLKKTLIFLRWNRDDSILMNISRCSFRLIVLYIALNCVIHAPFVILGNISIASRDSTGHEDHQSGAVYEIGLHAGQGDTEAMEKLAILYDEGGQGIGQNNCKSLFWFDKAARNGSSHAQLQMAVAYYSGIGLPVNYELAYYWAKHAERNGEELARFAQRLDIIQSALPKDVKQDWEKFEPAKQPPAQIYNGPYLALLEGALFLPFASCREWLVNTSAFYR